VEDREGCPEVDVMATVTGLACVKCGKTYPKDDHIICPACGLEGILDVGYDYDEMRAGLRKNPLRSRKQRNIFRYADLLPLAGAPCPMLEVGWTPLYAFPRLNEALGHDWIYVKDDTVNPSSSLKDRASAVAVAMASEASMSGIACASTGNAASSLAVLSASAGIKSYIFVPETIPKPKLYQISACAAGVFRVKGTYEDAFDLATRAIARWGWYNRNCAINPYLVEGKKTCSLEIYEQLGYSVPDWLVVSVGDGCIISGQWKAFKELKLLGEITRLPRLLAVQASGCSPIVDAFVGSCDMKPVHAETIADSIRVGQPRNWRKAVRAIRESGGAAVCVDDDEIVSAMLLLGQRTGIFSEPAGATGLAGLIKALGSGIIGKGEAVAVLVTGSGLKDPESIGPRARVIDVEGDVDSLAAFI
jgi:threonine synthase